MKRFIPLMIVLLLTLGLAFVLDDFVRQVIVRPLLFLLWIAGLFLQSLPQFALWSLFVLVALIVLLKSLNTEITWPAQDRRQRVSLTRGFVAPWQRQLQRAETRPYFRWQLARSLAKLSQETLTPTDPFNPDETQSLADMIAQFPPEIAAYFQAELPRNPAVTSHWVSWQSDQKEAAPELDVEAVVEFLEKETAWE